MDDTEKDAEALSFKSKVRITPAFRNPSKNTTIAVNKLEVAKP